MPGATGQPPLSEAPLYIRWGPDKCSYAIELKLDLVDQLRRALLEGQRAGVEIGGILIGSLPTPLAPTLRIEDVELLARRVQDGATFIVDGDGGERFAEVRLRARAKERSAVGLFRSHLREGPLRPSLADRTLLAGEFKEPVYALFVVQGSDPFDAAFFVASNGPLPAETSVREFQLNPAEFRSLPEIETEVPRKYSAQVSSAPSSRWRNSAAIFLIVLGIAAALYYFNRSLFPPYSLASGSLQLLAESHEGLLIISWNRAAQDLDQSSGGEVDILPRNGGLQRRVHLGVDELRLGTIAYQLEAARVEVLLTLDHPGAVPTRYSAIWHK